LYERIAWAHAKAGDRSATEKALAAVERHYDQRRPDDEPTWVYWLDDKEIQVMAGRCYVELGLPQRAEPLLVDAVARCDEDPPAKLPSTAPGSPRPTCRQAISTGPSRKPHTSTVSTPAQDQPSPPTGSNTCTRVSPRFEPIRRSAPSRTSTKLKRIFQASRVTPEECGGTPGGFCNGR